MSGRSDRLAVFGTHSAAHGCRSFQRGACLVCCARFACFDLPCCSEESASHHAHTHSARLCGQRELTLKLAGECFASFICGCRLERRTPDFQCFVASGVSPADVCRPRFVSYCFHFLIALEEHKRPARTRGRKGGARCAFEFANCPRKREFQNDIIFRSFFL